MQQILIPAESRTFLHLPFTEAPGDITTLPVQMAVTAYPDSPAEDDWVTAAWTPGASPPASRILIGPGTSKTLPKGSYVLWGRVTATPEQPVVESTYVVEIT